MEIKQFKIRASATSKIMAGQIGLTDKQKEELSQLMAKEKRTSLQETKLLELITKMNNKELPEGAKTYCREWLKGQILMRNKNISSMAIEKGNIMEDDSIDFVAKKLGYPMLIKNLDYFENNFICGTPDILPASGPVIDIKNSWSFETFPLLEDELPNKDYFYQLQSYMDLTGRVKAVVAYTLNDTPTHLIERQARIWCTNNGYEGLDIDVYNQFHDRLTYSDIEDKFKIKMYAIEYQPEIIKQIYERVELCRIYIEELKTKFLN